MRVSHGNSASPNTASSSGNRLNGGRCDGSKRLIRRMMRVCGDTCKARDTSNSGAMQETTLSSLLRRSAGCRERTGSRDEAKVLTDAPDAPRIREVFDGPPHRAFSAASRHDHGRDDRGGTGTTGMEACIDGRGEIAAGIAAGQSLCGGLRGYVSGCRCHVATQSSIRPRTAPADDAACIADITALREVMPCRCEHVPVRTAAPCARHRRARSFANRRTSPRSRAASLSSTAASLLRRRSGPHRRLPGPLRLVRRLRRCNPHRLPRRVRAHAEPPAYLGTREGHVSLSRSGEGGLREVLAHNAVHRRRSPPSPGPRMPASRCAGTSATARGPGLR